MRLYAIRYYLTHVDPDSRQVTSQTEHWIATLFSGDTAERQARDYFSRYINGVESAEPGLAESIGKIYPDAMIDWQVVQLIDAEYVAEALTNVATAISDR